VSQNVDGAQVSKKLSRILWILAGGAILLFALRTFVGDVYRVSSASMQPSLREGEYVLVLYPPIFELRPDRFDMVVVSRAGDAVVKRVVGLGGETVQVGPYGDLFIDGGRIDRTQGGLPLVPVFDDTILDAGEHFVMGGSQVDPWTRDGAEWVLDARELPRGSFAGMLRLHRAVRDDFIGPEGIVERGVFHVGDLATEFEFQALEPGGRLRVRLVEQGDSFEFSLELDAAGTVEGTLVRLPPEGEGGPLASARFPFEPGVWIALRFSNVDNELVVEFGSSGEHRLRATYDHNRPLAGANVPPGASIGERVLIGGEGCHLRIRSIRVERDLHFTRRGDLAGPTPLRLGPDELFLLGDNSRASRDSREWGAVDGGDLVGRAAWVVWPLSAARRLASGP
jgi:signal peptidase I